MTKPTGLDLLRAEFPPNHIGKLPKPTKAQTDAVKKDFKVGIRCKDCGGWHHPKVVHLDYVGHAPLTHRLLDADPDWNWEPLAFDNETGLPVYDKTGGLWIKLTVCGVTRLGYGNATSGGEAGNREKEVIGDALRNAGMRFGIALDLWHKGELHVDEHEKPEPKKKPKPEPEKKSFAQPNISELIKALDGCKTEKDVEVLEQKFVKKYTPKILLEKIHPQEEKIYSTLFTEYLNRVNK